MQTDDGRVSGDTLGRATFHGRNGISVVDYAICDQDTLSNVANFVVKQPCSLSDHISIITWLNINTNISELGPSHESNRLSHVPIQFLWEKEYGDNSCDQNPLCCWQSTEPKGGYPKNRQTYLKIHPLALTALALSCNNNFCFTT